jgi:histidinol-phosphatase
MNYTTELEFAKQLGQSAYEIAQKYYKKNPDTTIKSDNSPVTIADEEINQLVIDQIKESFPSHGVLGEEQSFGLDRESLWVCDPIDGTLAFTLGIPMFMFSIALVENGRPIMAVITDLSTGKSIFSEHEHGSFNDSGRVAASYRSISQAKLLSLRNTNELLKDSDFWNTLGEKSNSLSSTFGAVFKGALIAEGLADGTVWLRNVNAWDLAAITLIVREAGGIVSDKHGNQDIDCTKSADGLILSNRACYEELLAITVEHSTKN